MKIGKVSESILKRSILKQIKTKRNEVLSGAGVGEDCAIFALSDAEVLTSCVQEANVAKAGNISLILGKCANNLAASGSEPIAAAITLILPESVEEADLKNLMKEAESACAALHMQIAVGHTTVTDAVKEPIAVVTGYGKADRSKARTTKGAKPEQDIIVSKWIGLEGTAILAKAYGEELLTRYPSYLVEEAADFHRYLSILPEAAVAVKSGVCVMHDASEGGIFAALWELAESSGVGLTIDLKKLPIRQETVEVCEFCNVNPYELLSGGCLLMTAEDGAALVKALEAEHIPAAVVGKITAGNDRVVMNEEETRFLDRPRTDEIYKMYHKYKSEVE